MKGKGITAVGNLIEVKNLTKEYKQLRAVDNLSFDVHEGEILGLLGPNGSGKSTTINCMLSLLNYGGGDISIFGERMSPDAYGIKKRIGVVFQDIAVFEELTVYDNIDYFCGLYISDKTERKQCISDAIALVGLENYTKFRPKQLSGGLLRRLNIACGIAHKPKLVFLDEPTVAVDPQSRNNILDGIKKLRDGGATVVYTTHYMEEVELICDRIIILDKGRIIAQGSSDELKELANIEEKITVEFGGNVSAGNLIPERNTQGSFPGADYLINEIKSWENVDSVTCGRNSLYITYRAGNNNLTDIRDYLREKNISYNKIYSERPTLNDVFLELTGKELRD